ncbi:MAG: hypothetical protein MJ172_06410 [Clostridia bacterium]|nr:hypothetical protein [Clostridia bacterium]
MTCIKNDKINILGRHIVNDDNSVSFFWTGSGIEFLTNTTNVVLNVEAKYGALDIWVTVEVNGAFVSRTMLFEGENKIGVLHSMEEGKFNRVRILKETQLEPEGNHYLRFISLTDFDGNDISLGEPPKYDMVIDFYGDSLTTGEGLHGSVGQMDFVAAYMGFEEGYARKTADSLNADYRICSQSGWGVKAGFNNNINLTIPRIYKYIDGKSVPFDFSEKPADVVIINLGTNDWAAFNAEPWVSEEGVSYKLKLDENGLPVEEDANLFVDKGITFLNELLEYYPKAKFVWVTGMCKTDMAPLIKKVIDGSSDSSRIKFVEVLSSDDLDYGSREHPGPLTHTNACQKILEALK